MEGIDQYLRDTGTAVRQLFAARQFYKSLLDEIHTPVRISDGNDDREGFDEWVEQNREKLDAASEARRRYLAQTISESAICGSLLQIAYMGIQTYNDLQSIPSDFTENIKDGLIKARKCCVGRRVKNVPLGLIIYAARNIFNHSDEVDFNNLNKLNKEIFRRLAEEKTERTTYMNPAFDLSLKHNYYVANTFWLVRWNTVEDFERDMSDMIK